MANFFFENRLAIHRYFFALTCGAAQVNCIFVWLNEEFIIENKVIKYNWIYDPCCEIKYLNFIFIF